MFKGITRTSKFWGVFTAICILSAVVGGKYLFKVTPMLSLDITMNREQALAQSKELSTKYSWPLANYRQATIFENDSMAQFFAELECGGIDTFKEMINKKLYEPYKWHVRHFKEQVVHEVHTYFTPDGTPYGFELKLPESDNPGNLSVTQARALALQLAQKDWNISFDDFKEVEASQDTKPSGRVDHTFLYERTNATLGEDGKYKIKLVVSGNMLSALTQFVQIPEAFQRRYLEIRSANNMFSSAFGFIFRILYLLIGGFIGSFILIRHRRSLIKPTSLVLLGILTLTTLAQLNNYPLTLMHYNTATPLSSHLYSVIMGAFIGFLINFVTYLLIIAAAEGFDRWAFGHHLQFWKLYSKDIGGSLSVLGRTLGGYFLLSTELLLMTVTYFILNKGLGWWMPSGTLINPNILATYVPWLSGFAPSLFAGFWEECGLRALPLAGAYLVGKRYGKEKQFLGVMFIVQAIIFGGLHTSYVQQPVYLRIVELFVPSLIWAAAYLNFGLLPGIICHYLWDLMWFTAPVMVSKAPGMFFQKLMIVLLALAPLFIVLFRRWQAGAWRYAGEAFRNAAWKVPTVAEKTTKKVVKVLTTALPNNTRNIIFGIGIAGILAFASFGLTKNSNPQLTITKEQAIAAATKALQSRPGANKQWKTLACAQSHQKVIFDQKTGKHKPSFEHAFIWQTEDKDRYQSLLGTYLSTAHWQVRFASFEGDVAERAEEYLFFVDNNGTVFRTLHKLPEQRPGASLSQGEARGIALAAANTYFNLGVNALKELSALDVKRLDRKDWVFVFQDTTQTFSADGQAHIRITIAGKEVVDYQRSVFVPEEWQRSEERRNALCQQIQLLCVLLFILLSMLAAGSAGSLLIQNFNFKRTFMFFAFFVVLSIVSLLNGLPFFTFNFITAQPFSSQLFSLISNQIGSTLIMGLLSAAFAGQAASLIQESRYTNDRSLPLIGSALAAGLFGICSCMRYFLPTVVPPIANLDVAAFYLPTLQILFFAGWTIRYSILFVMFSYFITKLTNNWKTRMIQGALLTFIAGFATIGFLGVEHVTTVFVLGSLTGIALLIAHYYVLSNDASLALPIVSTLLALNTVKEGFLQGYPFALVNSILAACIVMAINYCWFNYIRID